VGLSLVRPKILADLAAKRQKAITAALDPAGGAVLNFFYK